MNITHFHLLFNHFPVIGTLIGSGLLIWGIIKKQNNIKSMAAALLAIMAIIAIPVYLTGEPAEKSVENMAGISESMIELHEDAAKLAIWAMGATGLAALVALFFDWRKKKTANSVYIIAVALSVFCFALMARTGYYGGQIRHTELNAGNTTVQQNDMEKKGIGNKQTRKDDD